MKKFSYSLLLPVLLAACGQADTRSGFSVKGKIDHCTEKTITLSELTPKGLIFLDTALVAPDGSFEFNGTVTEETFCAINLPKGTVVVVVDTASDIILSLDAGNPDHYVLSGSPESEELRMLIQVNNGYMAQVRTLQVKYAGYGDDVPPAAVQEQISRDYDSIMNKRTKELQQFVMNKTNSIVPYFATNYLMPEDDFVFLESVDKKLYDRFPSSRYAQEHHTRVEKLRKTAEGQTAPDIVLADPYGKTIALSSLQGKYVLVDFWASWCRPCREESPRLVKLYNRYKAYGFEVFSVSLDEDRDAWMKAISDDRLFWTHVSDLKKWNSSVAEQYNIESIPFTLLLNKEGKIIARKLSGEALEKKVEEAIKGGL